MKQVVFLLSILTISLSACGCSKPGVTATQKPTITLTPAIAANLASEQTQEMETLQAIPTFTPLPGPCVTPDPSTLNVFIDHSLTIEDNGKTFVTHVTSRFWIYLDDRIYPLRDLLNAIPAGLFGMASNGMVRGPQCYPVYFEVVHEGKGHLILKDFSLSIIVDNNLPMSQLPLH